MANKVIKKNEVTRLIENLPRNVLLVYDAAYAEYIDDPNYIDGVELVEKNENVILCERGISAPHTHKATSRFLLDLQAIPAIKDNSCLPIISDPSHACFWHEWVKPLTLGSIATGAEGIMVEFHENPREAAVDPLQAISFKEFEDLVDQSRNLAESLNKKIV